MQSLLIRNSSSRELSNAIRKSMVGNNYAEPKIQKLIDNQAARDDQTINEAIQLLESYAKMGVNPYKDRLQWLLSSFDK